MLVTWRHRILTRFFIVGLLAVLCWTLYTLAYDPEWNEALIPFGSLTLVLAIYCVVVWVLGLLAPHAMPTLGLPDPLQLLFTTPPTEPLLRSHSTINWDAAIPLFTVKPVAPAKEPSSKEPGTSPKIAQPEDKSKPDTAPAGALPTPVESTSTAASPAMKGEYAFTQYPHPCGCPPFERILCSGSHREGVS